MGNNGNKQNNYSGCRDITTYMAIKNVRYEERRKLISELKVVANKHGYRIVCTIRLKELDGGDNGE